MLVYHFVNAHYGIEDIHKRRLKISRLMDLNDPFEFLGADLSNREFRRALKDTKVEISKSKGLLCFSEAWKNPVLWGHYADKHKGLCLGFEVPDDTIKKIEYLDSRFSPQRTLDEEFMKKLLFTKFKHWEYEQEYRIYTRLKEHIGGIYYSEFSDQLRLKRVIVGAQSEVTRAQVSEALGEFESTVEAFKARTGFTNFEVVRQLNIKKWA